MNISLHPELIAWLIRQAGAKRVKMTVVIAGEQPPKWHYEKGWTKWKNGRPKKYTPSESTVTVGADWLAHRFPVAWSTMRMAGIMSLDVSGDDILAAERLMLDMERWRQCAAKTQVVCDIVQRIKEIRCTDPENERLYA